MTKIKATKKTLRTSIRSTLQTLPSTTLHSESFKLWQHLAQTEMFKNAASIGVFCNMDRCEVFTKEIIDRSAEMGKSVYFPKVYFDEKEKRANDFVMDMIKQKHNVTSTDVFEKWERNKWGIPEPPVFEDEFEIAYGAIKKEKPSLNKIDILLLPGLLFDCNGNRLGQGLGYYDRYISKIRDVCKEEGAVMPVLIGVGFVCQIIENNQNEKRVIPVDENDVVMDGVLSPEGFQKGLF